MTSSARTMKTGSSLVYAWASRSRWVAVRTVSGFWSSPVASTMWFHGTVISTS